MSASVWTLLRTYLADMVSMVVGPGIEPIVVSLRVSWITFPIALSVEASAGAGTDIRIELRHS